ncbi:hypothetical protein BGZ95_000143, partial [Linnemannia exigua]
IVPHAIKHCPGVVLDIILSATVENIHTDSSASSTLTLADSVSALAITTDPFSDPPSAELRQSAMTRVSTTHIQSQLSSTSAAIELARQSGKPLTSEALPSLVASKLTPVSMGTPGFERTVIHKLDGLTDQGAVTQQIVRDVLELQKQMNDRLMLIQSKTEAILTQQLELTEYPIPRLFIVLPEEPGKYDPGNWFRTKFRLHFICECGKHTEANNSKISHHLHLAKHEGYLIREPTEFFKKYGPFLLLMLELIKCGTSIAGHVVPTLASLKVVELADSVKQSVELVVSKIDYSAACIDYQLAKIQGSSLGDFIDTEPGAAVTQQDLANYLSDVEGLEGVELRQLRSFLTTSEEENLLGNLYRMTTSDGHVKWVCRDHYRASHQEKYTQRLRDVVQLARGEFDEQLGRIEIVLGSKFAAAEFYNAVNKARGVLELAMDWNWECTGSDLEDLERALKNSTVSILRLDLRQFRTSLGSKLFSTSPQYKGLFRITGLPTMKAIHIVLPKKFFKIYSLLSNHPSHLYKLSFEMTLGDYSGIESRILAETSKTTSDPIWHFYFNPVGSNGVQALSEALKTNSTQTTLGLQINRIGPNGAQVLSEALKTNSTLTKLDLFENAIGPYGAQDLSEALKTNSTLTKLNLRGNLLGSSGVQALSEALMTNSTLATLNLCGNLIGPNGAQALSEALQTNSTLTTLELGDNSIGDNGAQLLSEALKTNSTLTSLNMYGNSIGPNGAQALSEALKTNSTLRTFYVGENSLGPKGAQLLSEALKINSTLTALDVGFSSIGPNGAQALSEALKANSTLTGLYLGYNLIGDSGAQSLSEALKTNSTLTTLSLGNNSIGTNGSQALSEALKTNSTVSILGLQD